MIYPREPQYHCSQLFISHYEGQWEYLGRRNQHGYQLLPPSVSADICIQSPKRCCSLQSSDALSILFATDNECLLDYIVVTVTSHSTTGIAAFRYVHSFSLIFRSQPKQSLYENLIFQLSICSLLFFNIIEDVSHSSEKSFVQYTIKKQKISQQRQRKRFIDPSRDVPGSRITRDKGYSLLLEVI